MDVDQLETFLAIAHLGGFTRAGTRVHRSQPAISRRLRMLESELGAPVFERERGEVRLTDVGRTLLPHAEAILAAHHDAKEAVAAQLRGGASSIAVAIVGTLVDARFCRRLKRFCDAYPTLSVTVRTGSSAEISQLVRQGQVTFGIRYFDESHTALTGAQIGRESMIVVGSGRHPKLKRQAVDAETLASQTWLVFPSTKAYKEAFGRLLRERLVTAGLSHVRLMEVDSLAAQKHMAEAGLGLALLPRSAVRAELARGILVHAHAPRIATSIPICLIQRKRAFLSDGARALYNHLSGALTSQAVTG